MDDLSGRTVLITGCSRGIGAEIARVVGTSGAHVIVHYNSDRSGAEAAVADVPTDRKCFIHADFDDLPSVEQLWQTAVEWKGRIDVLVNNAGIMLWHGGMDADLASWDEVWDKTLRVNVLAPARLMRNAVKHFLSHGGGSIITVSSWTAQRGVSNPNSLPYGASKAALHSMTQSIARGYARENILAYLIAPGVVDAPMSHAFAATQQGGRPALEEKLAMGAWVPPAEIGELVSFLATGRVRHLTGATLDVNGASNIR
jgi:NAD(P)-dependent dehydrogenase (short-subunit alcohol dehydrogenase family)